MIDRHGLAILDQLFTTYTSDFKEQALKRIIVDHEPANQVSIDLKKKDKERNNREIMAEIKAIYEEHKHRYGNRCITVELRRRGLLINYKKEQRLMNKLKLFGIE